ncbi:hypothetical protein AMTRI_Chr11g96150 [Amborella trichopoda]
MVLCAWQPAPLPTPLHFLLGEPNTSVTLDPNHWITVPCCRKPPSPCKHQSPNHAVPRDTQNPFPINHPPYPSPSLGHPDSYVPLSPPTATHLPTPDSTCLPVHDSSQLPPDMFKKH